MTESATSQVWGTPFDKEIRVQRHIEHQEEASAATLGAIQSAAQQAHIDSGYQQEYLSELLSAAWDEKRDRLLSRLFPEIAFKLYKESSKAQDIITELLDSTQEMTCLELRDSHKELTAYLSALASIDPTYIADVKLKEMFYELRTTFSPLVDQLNCELPEQRRSVLLEAVAHEKYGLLQRFSEEDVSSYKSRIDILRNRKRDMAGIEKKLGEWRELSKMFLFMSAVFAAISLTAIFYGFGKLMILAALFLLLGAGCRFKIYRYQQELSVVSDSCRRLALILHKIHPVSSADDFLALSKQLWWDGDSWELSPDSMTELESRFDKEWSFPAVM